MTSCATRPRERLVRCSSPAVCFASARSVSAWPCSSGSATSRAAGRAASTSAWSAQPRRSPRWCSRRSSRATRIELGRRLFLVAGPVICVVAVLLLALGVRPAQLGGARLLEGLGAAAFVPVALGTVAAATSGDRRRRAGASGAFEASTLIGYAGGFGLGSVAYFGLHRGAFVLLAGAVCAARQSCASSSSRASRRCRCTRCARSCAPPSARVRCAPSCRPGSCRSR